MLDKVTDSDQRMALQRTAGCFYSPSVRWRKISRQQFHLGERQLRISTIDPDGIALAALQELAKQNEQKDTKMDDLETRVKQLKAAILQFGNLIKADKQ